MEQEHFNAITKQLGTLTDMLTSVETVTWVTLIILVLISISLVLAHRRIAKNEVALAEMIRQLGDKTDKP
jgi:hypothetical protein